MVYMTTRRISCGIGTGLSNQVKEKTSLGQLAHSIMALRMKEMWNLEITKGMNRGLKQMFLRDAGHVIFTLTMNLGVIDITILG